LLGRAGFAALPERAHESQSVGPAFAPPQAKQRRQKIRPVELTDEEPSPSEIALIEENEALRERLRRQTPPADPWEQPRAPLYAPPALPWDRAATAPTRSEPLPAAPVYNYLQVKPNGYGLGVNQDQFGGRHVYRLQDGSVEPGIFNGGVKRDAYGLGVHMDQFGRPVTDSAP
jgi:hypothetical protein